MPSPQRLPKLRPDQLDADQRALHETITGGRRAAHQHSVPLADGDGCLEGPFNAFLLQPSVGQPLQALGAALRYDTALAARHREIAVLVVAARTSAAFERYAHEPVARSLGLSEEQLAGIRAGDHAVLAADEALVADAVRELLDTGDLSDGTYEAVRSAIGVAQLFELTTLVGYYRLLALQLRVFRVATPDDTIS